LREPYPVRVSAAKSTPLRKSYHILSKIAQNTPLKPFPCKASTPLNEKSIVSAIWRVVSMMVEKLPSNSDGI